MRTLDQIAAEFSVRRLRRSASTLLLAGLGILLGSASVAQPWLPPPVPHFATEMTAAEVKDKILAIVPGLADPAKTEIERAEIVRDWLHEYLPIADGSCDLWNLGADHNNDGLGKLFYMCEMRLGGYYCGGQAEIARKVYELLGFETFTFNFGFDGTRATHVTTFVKLKINGQDLWTIQDVYFNFTLRDRAGYYLGFRQLLAYLAENDLAPVVVDEKTGARTPVLHTEPDRVPRLNRRYGLESECVREWDGFEEFTIKWDFDLFQTTYFDLSQELTARLGNDNPLYLFILPIGYKGQDYVQDIEQEIRAAQKSLLRKLGVVPAQLSIPINHPPKFFGPI